jgi:1-aminocyclopropane-1-carboxylate synthase
MVCPEAIRIIDPSGDAQAHHSDGFNIDTTARSRAILHGVDTGPHDPSSPETLEAFERDIAQLRAEGKRVRLLILCNPHNPLGFCYPRETLLAYMRFAERHDLHLLSDEIYALSLFDNPNAAATTPFTSVLAIDPLKEAECNPARIHMAYGMSKDFCSNGLRGGECARYIHFPRWETSPYSRRQFRIACLVTQHNPALRQGFTTIVLLMRMSSAADQLWSSILDNDVVLDDFVKTNRKRLTETFTLCRNFFIEHKIPFIEPNAAFFIWSEPLLFQSVSAARKGELTDLT